MPGATASEAGELRAASATSAASEAAWPVGGGAPPPAAAASAADSPPLSPTELIPAYSGKSGSFTRGGGASFQLQAWPAEVGATLESGGESSGAAPAAPWWRR